jgi:hypothetical protein
MAEGEMYAGALQIDAKEGTCVTDFPAIRAATTKTFRRDFVSGPPKWMANKPIIQNEADPAYDMFSNLLRANE